MTKKYLYLVVSLTITVLLCYSGLSIYNKWKALSDGTTRKQDVELQYSQEYDIVKYDGYDINGSQVINQIKILVSKYQIPITVKGSTNPEFTISSADDFQSLRDINSAHFINSMKLYYYEVIRDANDVIIKVNVTENP